MDRFVHGGNIYDDSPSGMKWFDFSANINPLGLSDSVKKAISDKGNCPLSGPFGEKY